MAVDELVRLGVAELRALLGLDAAVDRPIALGRRRADRLRQHLRRHAREDGQVLAVQAPPLRRRHLLGVQDHGGSGEDAVALAVHGELPLGVGHALGHLEVRGVFMNSHLGVRGVFMNTTWIWLPGEVAKSRSPGAKSRLYS